MLAKTKSYKKYFALFRISISDPDQQRHIEDAGKWEAAHVEDKVVEREKRRWKMSGE